MEKSEEQLKNKKEKPKEASVQAYLEIAEAEDNFLVMKDGSLRAILMVSSLNFDLKSQEEQESIILQYQSFLNSLNFPLQIVIRSKRLDLDNYLFRLGEKKKKEGNEFLKIQMEQYIDFIKSLLEFSNIMDKKFYIVVPFYPSGISNVKKIGFFEKIANSINPTLAQKNKKEEIQKHKEKLFERINLVAEGLNDLGLRAAQLSTIDLIELFYEIYNLDTAQREKLINVEDITSDIVEQEG